MLLLLLVFAFIIVSIQLSLRTWLNGTSLFGFRHYVDSNQLDRAPALRRSNYTHERDRHQIDHEIATTVADMCSFPDSETMQAASCRTLTRIFEKNDTAKSTIIRCDCIELVLTAMRSFPHSETIEANGCVNAR
eukprot:GILJ01010088.1.p1 GENE.GILJ01010088.1~~GILJ01010088.1.p1  ORF type:complete len:134 (+),score=2.22 GILJ01010088.1:57-458(+)